MKPSGLGIIELFRKQSYFHAMNKSITQTAQYDKQISKSIKRFHVYTALKASDAYKKRRGRLRYLPYFH